ncbi:MAG: hypothetical protein O3C21_03060 [Verrucomicrobia bacterium]|nr:hypothetical protein [Verrucomicrobiota bacterium]
MLVVWYALHHAAAESAIAAVNLTVGSVTTATGATVPAGVESVEKFRDTTTDSKVLAALEKL